MSSEDRKSPDERDWRAFHDLVALAESVQARRDKLFRQMIATAAFTGSLIPLFGLGFFAAGQWVVGPYGLSKDGILIVILLSFAFSASLLVFGLAHFRRLDYRERRAHRKVISIAHEVLEASRKNLTPLEIAEIEIRLSRLDN